MKKVIAILLTTAALFSVIPAQAGQINSKVTSSNITGSEFMTEDAAFSSGAMLKNEIDALNSVQLSKELNHSAAYFSVNPNSFKILKSEVNVKKKINNMGDFVYVPMVNVNYEYKYIERS
ncbi:DUF3316 domain-containing protein [Vibrio scophthalmi]|uniref:DUF3316 domain-containing protein n=1 Tax=Vibrio scophthalmi LMG 19158 TaxID=870967 RepID=F9RK72_9VIBR|nr:DUF3316 domain-containing protein [Vibrio scophthalmi]EGU40074.1 hypothetical protein VIS19158_04791 [Vibrio scophthalmi LMG 19158]